MPSGGIAKADFVAQLDRAAASLGEARPVTTALLRHMADALRKGDPPWWQHAQKAWEKREFVHWTEAWTLFLTAIHADVLGDAESPLVPYFPSCGGTAEADPTTIFARYLNDLPHEFFEVIKKAHRRTFLPRRSPLWIPPAIAYFQKRRLPYYLVEVNSGGGLNLAADVFFPLPAFAPDAIAARIGLEPMPLNLEEIKDRRWLTAGHLPDSIGEIQGMDQIIDSVVQRMRREAAFIQLAQCDTLMAPTFIARNIPSDDPDVGLFVFNMATSSRMTDAQYEQYARDMGEMLAPWGDRGLWLEVEGVRGELYSTTFQGTLHRPAGNGTLRSMVMVRFDHMSGQVAFPPGPMEQFLAVASPPKAAK